MQPELFRIPFLNQPIHSYGLMLVIGFMLALQLAKFLARRSGLDADTFVNAGLIALVSGIVGARLSHVIENWGEYTRGDLSFGENLWNAVNLTSGGLTYYGGVLLAFPVTVLYGVYKKMPLRTGMDIIAPCLMVGLGFGRIGCFLNGCCYGAECELPAPLGVEYPYGSNAYLDQHHKRLRGEPGGLRHPPPPELIDRATGGLRPLAQVTRDPALRAAASAQHSNRVHNAQIYSTVTALLLAALLTAYYTLPHAPGRGFALMMILEGGTRYLLELLRAEPLQVGPLTLSMAIGIALFAGGIIAWLLFGWANRSTPEPGAIPAPA
jgi:phosphatidylglycerol:prolipoprotein diacylglycerol transferase